MNAQERIVIIWTIACPLILWNGARQERRNRK